MNLTTLIDGREATPIRAIPFITGWKISPDLVVSALAHTDHYALRFEGVVPCHLSVNGRYSPMLPKEWDGIEAELDVLSRTLQNSEDIIQERYPDWRRASILLLPPACFVWKDDFENAFRRAYSVQNYEILDERPGDRELNFSPYMPDALRENVMEGFPRTERSVTQQWPWGDYNTPLLLIMSSAVKRWCLSGEYPQKKTGEIQEWIKAEMEKAQIPISQSLVDHIETIISPRTYSHTRQRAKRKD